MKRGIRPKRRIPGIGIAGLVILGVFVAAALASPWLAPKPMALVGDSFEAPSTRHLLGTNQIGQDLFGHLLVGARASLLLAAMTGFGTLLLGGAVGLTAGWVGGRTDIVLMRLIDVVLAIPRLPLLLLIAAYAKGGLVTVAVIMSAVFWPGTARVLRTQVRSLRNRLHVRAATTFGAGWAHVVRRHLLPEIGLVLVASLVAAASRAVVFEAGLAFLGIGDQSRISWGKTINEARASPGLFYVDLWKWWMLPPVAAIVFVMLGFTFVGMAIEQRANPRVSRHQATAGMDVATTVDPSVAPQFVASGGR